MATSVLVNECLEKFRIGCDIDRSAKSAILDELGRFRGWVDYNTAHLPAHDRKSLEYRMRNSSRLKDTVFSLLQDLNDALDGLIGRGTQSSGTQNAETTKMMGQEQCEIALSVEDEDMFELSDEEFEDVEEIDPLQQAINEVHEIMSSLAAFSDRLHNPSRTDTWILATIAESISDDQSNVHATFPTAPGYLPERLASAISKHRAYLKHCRTHRGKLSEELQDYGAIRATTRKH